MRNDFCTIFLTHLVIEDIDSAHIGCSNSGVREESMPPISEIKRTLIDTKQAIDLFGDSRLHREQVA